jgi:hypothetical protein
MPAVAFGWVLLIRQILKVTDEIHGCASFSL